MSRLKSIHKHTKERIDLAVFLAEDGAFHTAAQMLRELADDVEAHAAWCDRKLAEAIAASKTRESA